MSKHLWRQGALALLVGQLGGCEDNLIEVETVANTHSNSASSLTTVTGDASATLPSVETTSSGSVFPPDPAFTHSEAGGIVTTQVDATNREAWVYLDLDSRAVPASDAAEQGPWDLGFMRFEIKLNPGSQVEALWVTGAATFDSMTSVPEGMFLADGTDGTDSGTGPDGVFADWYDYDPATHLLTAKPRVYVVKSGDRSFYKVELLSYYNDAGTPAKMSFRWAPLAASR